MKKIKIFFLIISLFCFFCGAYKVNAYYGTSYDPDYYPVPSTGDCVKNGSCVVVCKYNNGFNEKGGKHDIERYESMAAIYYYPQSDGTAKWQIAWNELGSGTDVYQTTINSATVAFSDKNGDSSIKISSDAYKSLTNDFVCPSIAAWYRGRVYNKYDLMCFGNDHYDCLSDNTVELFGSKVYQIGTMEWYESSYDYYAYKGDNNYSLLDDFSGFNNELEVYYNQTVKSLDTAKKRLEIAERNVAVASVSSTYENVCYTKNSLENLSLLTYNKQLNVDSIINDFNLQIENLKKQYNFNLLPNAKVFENSQDTINDYFSKLKETSKDILKQCDILNEKLLEYHITQEQYEANKEQASNTTNNVNNYLSNLTIDLTPDINLNFAPVSDCKAYIGYDAWQYIQKSFDIIKYLTIIILVVMSIVDFVKAMVSQDKELLNKALITVVRRIIVAIIIFFLPLLINFVLDLLGIVDVNGTCGIG